MKRKKNKFVNSELLVTQRNLQRMYIAMTPCPDNRPRKNYQDGADPQSNLHQFQANNIRLKSFYPSAGMKYINNL